MKETISVKISRECYEIVRDDNIDYFIDEMLGIVDYSVSSKIKTFAPINSDDKVEIELSTNTFENLTLSFKSLSNYDSVAEMLIWTYLLIGRNI